MPYIGKPPLSGNYQVLDAITATTTDTYALTKASVAVFPQTPSNCIVSLNGVIQAPVSSYTISGSNIVFASALTGTDSIDFITVLGDVLSIGTPTDGTVTTAKLADSSVTLAKLTATGTKDATTFLRGDNTFASAGASAGQVIQVVSTTKTSVFTTTSTSFTDVTGLSVSITPSSASNKILIIASLQYGAQGGNCFARLMRDSTAICIGDVSQASQPRSSFGSANVASGALITSASQNFLDTPSTTSAITYKIQGISDGTTLVINRSINDTDNASHTTTASTITVMEIKG
jgi:hypothetical protein